MSTSQLTYSVFPTKAFDTELLGYRNNAYQAWHQLWDKVYKGQGSDFSVSSDDFLRQDLVAVVRRREIPLALHLYSFFDIECAATRASKYFQFFNEIYFAKLKKNRARHVMSMEYMSVFPQAKEFAEDIPLGRVVAILGTRLFGTSISDAIVATARQDFKVHTAAYDVGFECVEKDLQQRGFLCDNIVCWQGKQHASSNNVINDAVDALWESREIHPGCLSALNGYKDSGSSAA